LESSRVSFKIFNERNNMNKRIINTANLTVDINTYNCKFGIENHRVIPTITYKLCIFFGIISIYIYH